MIAVGKVTLEDGRKFTIVFPGYMEWDTNAWVDTGDGIATNDETGEELSDEECNRVLKIDYPGTKWENEITFFNHLCEEATWEMEEEDD